MFWVWVVVTVYSSGEITLAPGTNPGAWGSLEACEAALVAEKDFGYTAGWVLRTDEKGTRLVYEQATLRSEVQCFPVQASRATANQ